MKSEAVGEAELAREARANRDTLAATTETCSAEAAGWRWSARETNPRGRPSAMSRNSLAKRQGKAWHIFSMTDGAPHEDATWRERLVHFLHNRYVTYGMLILLMVDLALVITGVVLEIEALSSEVFDLEHCLEQCLEEPNHNLSDSCHHPEELGSKGLSDAESIVAWISVGILSIFLIEHLLMLVGLGVRRFFSHLFYVVDLAVVVLSLVLELVLQHAPESGLFIIARLWRFARIFHGLYQVGEKTVMEMDEELRKNLKPVHQNNLRAAAQLLRDDEGQEIRGDDSSTSPEDGALRGEPVDARIDAARRALDDETFCALVLACNRFLERPHTVEQHFAEFRKSSVEKVSSDE
uniref:Voltage-gated hydrogen channel 1 n=1 Tax=Erythrolobus australicus TaxID=1077150 RepID=A0A7S1TQ72_9RHOD|mmetsp:Transcript_944/g.2622  ORF Transcript_944/g.2622 Transcript_944/m.2622 type:complete len:352 (+) Transcript_944:2-1057(+)